jgi:nucleoside-diphosphate-sugar epimerase
MKAIVIGGTGHIGSYLVPGLVESGYEVVSLSRGVRKPYFFHHAWNQVQQLSVDRPKLEEAGEFGKFVADLTPDIVIDLMCFELESAKQLVEPLKGKIQHFLHCGSLWAHGYCIETPVLETESRKPITDYGRKKARIEEYLLREARLNGFPATVLHPGHIVGKGWSPVNPLGNHNPKVFEILAAGDTLKIPHLGLETLHHVHADDVAQAFINAINCWNGSVGESFNVASTAALTLRGFAERAAAWFGKETHLEFLPWEQWEKNFSREDVEDTRGHLTHSTNASIEKAGRLIGYRPRYSSLEAVYESVMYLVEIGQVKV